ncbi:MAG: DUF2812 domain-containing protein [Lachnospiraceae bacterium]|nr:DUF2812 domain-containing protein [Lachnospiraceae bacterium]
MRKVIHKWFWVWDFEKEEKWLNEMAAKGLVLVAVGWCRFEFEDCVPGEYKIRLDFLENKCARVENEKYIAFLEETGAEQVGMMSRWIYFRKKVSGDNFQLFSDNNSRVHYLTRIIRFVALLSGLNLYFGCYNMFMFFQIRNYSYINLLGIVNLLLAVIGGWGVFRISRKRKKLKAEQQIFE